MPQLLYLRSPAAPVHLGAELDSLSLTNPVIDIDADQSVPHLCLAINQRSNGEPLVVVASGERCLDLPAIARAQAAAHRSVVGYALISPIFPTSTDHWPEAPVTVYLPSEADPEKSVSLRGYSVEHFEGAAGLARMIVAQAHTAQ